MTNDGPNNQHPFVSVIIPFYNNHQEVIEIEKSLRRQSYPSERFETIFIDNGSNKSFQFPKSFSKKNILLKEDVYRNSPYSARNRGLEVSIGTFLAFVDANSIPNEDWLEMGIYCLQNSGRDIVGGRVDFDFQNQVTAGKIVDALTSINMEKAIRERGAAYTANLFVKKNVFDDIGFFEEGTRSGGDVRWTLKAKEHGYNIDFCKSAIVRKYARSTKAMYRKKIRTGRGYFYSWKTESKKERKSLLYNFIRSLKPPTIKKIRLINPDRYIDDFDKKIMAIWFHLYLSGIATQFSFVMEWLSQAAKK